MLVAPDLSRMGVPERAHFERFLQTSLARELEDEAASWAVASWPRVDGYPARFILRSEAFDEVEVTFHDAKVYTSLFRERPPAIRPRMSVGLEP
jgi:hypothetical protein